MIYMLWRGLQTGWYLQKVCVHLDYTTLLYTLLCTIIYVVAVKDSQTFTRTPVCNSLSINCLHTNNLQKLKLFTSLDVYARYVKLSLQFLVLQTLNIYFTLQLSPTTVPCKLSEIHVAFCYDKFCDYITDSTLNLDLSPSLSMESLVLDHGAVYIFQSVSSQGRFCEN